MGATDNGPKLPKTHYLQLGNHAKEAWRSLSAKDKQLIMDGSRKADGLTKQMKTTPTKVNKSVTEPIQVHATQNTRHVLILVILLQRRSASRIIPINKTKEY